MSTFYQVKVTSYSQHAVFNGRRRGSKAMVNTQFSEDETENQEFAAAVAEEDRSLSS